MTESWAAELLAANERYASGFDRRDMPRSPARQIAIVTCIDARMHPAELLGLELGDANVIRNAGAVVTDDVIRSLAISKHILGTDVVVVMGHTDCGLEGVTDEEFRVRVGMDIEFRGFDDVEAAVQASVRRILTSPHLHDRVLGLIYDVTTGRVRRVA